MDFLNEWIKFTANYCTLLLYKSHIICLGDVTFIAWYIASVFKLLLSLQYICVLRLCTLVFAWFL